MNLVIGIILLVAAVFLIVAVLMQSGKSKNLSGAIAGGAETFFGKTKGRTIDRVLSRLTTVVAIIFVILVIVAYVAQPNTPATTAVPETSAADTTVDTNALGAENTTDTTAAPESVSAESGEEASTEPVDNDTAAPQTEPEA